MSFFAFDLLDGSPIVSSYCNSLNGDVVIEEEEEELPPEDGGVEDEIPSVIVAPVPRNHETTTLSGRDSPFILEMDIMDERRTHLDDEGDGITIVSSAPSDLTSVPVEAQTVRVLATAPTTPRMDTTTIMDYYALSPHPQFSTEHALSISTTDSQSVFTSYFRWGRGIPPVHDDDDDRSNSSTTTGSFVSPHITRQSCSFLSLNPYSLPSSVATNISLPSSVPSNDDDSSYVMVTSPPHNGTGNTTLACGNRQCREQFWYEAMATEKDWESLRERALAILEALGEDMSSPDALLAQLIQEEEARFWKQERGDQGNALLLSLKWPGWRLVGDLALLAATAAVASMSFHSLARRRILNVTFNR